jgi:methyl-accepting chemotaxis protein
MMKSIKYKMLLSFCITALISVALIGGVISLKMNQSILQQSELFVADMKQSTYETLYSPHQTSVSWMRNSIRRSVDRLCQASSLIANLESAQLKALEAELYTTAMNQKLDFAIVLNLHGQVEASFPAGIYEIEFERYMQSWEFGAHILHALQDETTDTNEVWEAFSRHDSHILETLGLSERDISGKGALSIVAAGIVTNDFDEPLGLCLIGKLLNDDEEFLQQLYEITGFASAIYLDTVPIAHAGFESDEKKTFDRSALQIRTEVQEDISHANEGKSLTLSLAGDTYIVACSTLKSFAGKPLGIFCTGFPESQVAKMQEKIFFHNIKTKESIQNWILGIGGISLSLFAAVSLVIATRITGPIKQLSTIANRVALGDFQQQVPVASSDEIGNLSKSLREVVNSLKEIATTSEAIAHGDLSSNITPRSEQDMLGQALQRMFSYLSEMASVATAIAEGDLTEKISLRSETDAFGRTMRTMTEGLYALIRQIRMSAEQIASSAITIASLTDQDTQIVQRVQTAVEQMITTLTEMGTSVEQVAQNMGTLFSSVKETSFSVSEVTSTITNIASNTTDLAQQTQNMSSVINNSVRALESVTEKTDVSRQLSRETMQDALEGQQAVEQVRESIDAIQQTNFNAVETITRFVQKSQEIGTILDVIRDITEQSALLALNASIIAAQAGSQGRGFSVIAEEMKNLANGVAASTKNIATIVQFVQQETNTVVQMIHDSTVKIEQGVQRTQQAEQRLQKILFSAERSSTVVTEIAEALHEQMTASHDVMRVIEQVSSMTAEITRATNEQKAGMVQIHDAIEHIRDMAFQTQQATDEQLEGVRQIIDFASTVNTLMDQNLESSQYVNHATTADLAPQAQILLQLVDRFKLKT